jgi:hypothetical protein
MFCALKSIIFLSLSACDISADGVLKNVLIPQEEFLPGVFYFICNYQLLSFSVLSVTNT